MKCKYEGTGIWDGRCIGTKEVDPCPGYDKCKQYKPNYTTNADRIRAMSDEELVDVLREFAIKPMQGSFLNWLQQPAERRMIMGLDVSVIRRKDLICPKCGEVVDTVSMEEVDSGGRVWYPFLEEVGYYVSYDKRTEENDWYGKDMKLTKQQADKLYKFVKKNRPLYSDEIMELVASAQLEGQDVIINADW